MASTGPPPRVEEFLAGWCGAERSSLLLELVLPDVDYRRQLGLPCAAAGYTRCVPELSPTWVADAAAATSTPNLPSPRRTTRRLRKAR
jgi:hypothetical protein